MIHDVAIVGLGPAGITCSLQLKRYGVDFICFERKSIGGLLRNANLVENYLGFPGGISGTKLCSLMNKQLDLNNIEVVLNNVELINFQNDTFILHTLNKNYFAKRCVLATGTVPVEITNIEIAKQSSNNIYYEVAEIISIKNTNIAIIGSGDAAFDYALNLSENNNIAIYCRSEKAKALPLLIERAKIKSNIEINYNTSLIKINDNKNMPLLVLEQLGNRFEKNVDLVIIAIGRKPAKTRFGTELLEKYQYLLENERIIKIGDLKNGLFRQTSISCGDGMLAAMKIFNGLKGLQ